MKIHHDAWTTTADGRHKRSSTFLGAQYVARDGRKQPFFAGMFGIFGQGNVAGIGEALLPDRPAALPYYQPRNEQAMVHTAAAFAKTSNRLRAFACTSSIGPGATNMVTGCCAARRSIASRCCCCPATSSPRATRDPVLQQLETPQIARRLGQRLLQADLALLGSDQSARAAASLRLPEAMRVLTSPADTGAVTLALPQDVQAEAFDCPDALLRASRLGRSRARAPDAAAVQSAAELIRQSRRPLIDRRRRRALQRSDGCAAEVRRARPEFRSARPRQARVRCRSTTRRPSAPWARPGLRRRTSSRAKPTS